MAEQQQTQAGTEQKAEASIPATGTEQKTTETAAGATEAQTSKPKAPENYEFKAHEGHEFDTEVLGAFSGVAKKLDLSQEQAQELLDTVAPIMRERVSQQVETQINGWTEQTRADREIGGEKLGENMAIAQKAFAKFGTPELRKLLAPVKDGGFGLAAHPEINRLFYRIGKAIGDDTAATGEGGARTASAPTNLEEAAKALYS